MPATIFISYSHQDRPYLEELLAAVRPALKSVSSLAPWSDQEIASGARWEGEIRQSLASARAAVLLISNAFLNSRYIREQELPVLLPRALAGDLSLFTVYVTAVAKSGLTVPVPGSSQGTDDLWSIQAENTPDRPLEVMSPADRNALFVRLAEKLHALAPAPEPAVRRTSRSLPPGRRGGELRPECLIRLAWDGHTLERSLLLPGHQRWLSPDLDAAAALELLDLWLPGDPFDGDLLFELLFGRDPERYQELLADPWGEGSTAVAAPTRYPWRIRLLIDEGSPGLHCLPWTQVSHQGLPLCDYGWTQELTPPTGSGGRPEWPTHAFIMPGRILLCVPDAGQDLQAAAHLHDLRGLLQQLWKRPPPIFEATDAAELAAHLHDHSPRLVYYYGRVEQAGSAWRLRLPDGAGGTGLDLAALAGLWRAAPPSAVLLNLLGEEALAALPQTAALVGAAAAKFVGVVVSPRADTGSAQQTARAWLTGVLGDDQRRDPVAALHPTEHAFAACRTAYQHWDPQLGEAHLDEDLAHLLLDRTDQRARLLQARDDFFDLSPKLRVQCFLALGTRGNRVADFPQQVITHLQVHTRDGVHAYLCPLQLEATDSDPDRVEYRYRRRFGPGPGLALSEALRPPQVRHSREHLLAVLAWTLNGEATAHQRSAVARAILRWSRERLAAPCADDLRIISLIAVETADLAERDALRDDLIDLDESLTSGAQYRRTNAFSFDALAPLSGVDKRDLSRYFNSEHCTCPDGLRRDYPGLLLGEHKELSFAEAVRLIRAARDRGWYAMKAALEQHRASASSSRAGSRDPGNGR